LEVSLFQVQTRLLGVGLDFGGQLHFATLDASFGHYDGVSRLPSAPPRPTPFRRSLGPVTAEAWLEECLKSKKKGPGGKPGPKALGNGGVSSREDLYMLPQ
jgi:hypothetical protein